MSTQADETTQAGDAISILTDDHRRVEMLFGQLEARNGDARELVQQVIKELSVHSEAEEQVVYPALRERVPRGDVEAAFSVDEHQTARETMVKLDEMSPGDVRFPTLVTKLIQEVRGHVHDEETRRFAQLRQAMSQDELVELGRTVVALKKTVPTRPHPNAPHDGGVAQTVLGAATSVVDKVRDAVEARD